ncbi:MAG: 50S ribosomal protein L11 [Nanoarchaeota archaeon]|nr:50S ribosomal protein L11 [Nanoarchaeota archaeon]
MAKEIVEALIEGGKATAAPPLGPALGPLKVNIGQVVAAINEKTKSFKGMQVPIKVIVDSDTKEFEIEIGTPPAAALIKKEAGITKGSGNPLLDKVADLRIEQIIKIAKMKEDALLGKDLKQKVREIVGTCQSMGVLVEGKTAPEALKAIQEGQFDEQIKAEKTELTAEELKALEEEKKKLQADLEERRKQLEAKAKEIITLNKNKEPKKIKAALVEAKIPPTIIEKTMTEAGIVVVGEKKEAAAPAPAKK